MGDLIDRQAAIDALDCINGTEEVLRSLPSAQPTQTDASNTFKALDCVERQAAIEIIQSMYPGMPRVPWMRKDWQKRYEPYIRTENAIRKLPSVHPEIIRCKDCEDYQTDWETSYPNRHYCATMDSMMPEDGFCSYAERRTDE